MSDSRDRDSMECPSQIEVAALTTYEVAPDGSGVRMNVLDVDGKPAHVVVPLDCLRALALTMPKMLSDVLCGALGVPAVRVVHSVKGWFLERAQNDAAVLLTVETSDELRISFAIPESELVQIADALSAHEIEVFSHALRH